MTVLFIILGVLFIIGGVCCMFTPLATLVSAGYIIGVLMLVYGVLGIIRAVKEKGDALEWIMSILAVIVGIIALVRPGSTLVIDGVLIYALAAFFLVTGVIQIVLSLKEKDFNPNWFWMLIVGVLSVVLGIYSFTHPTFAALTVGILIGLYFVETGFSMITLGFVAGSDN